MQLVQLIYIEEKNVPRGNLESDCQDKLSPKWIAVAWCIQ